MTSHRVHSRFYEDFSESIRKFEPAGEQAVNIPDWDDYFHAIAQTVALRSKDRSRKVGAVIVDRENVLLATGYNWLARGIEETPERIGAMANVTEEENKKLKYRWVTHAEPNAIFNAARSGISVVGCTMYVTTHPCTACAQAIVQAGIKTVFTYGGYWTNEPGDYQDSIDLLNEAGVLVQAPYARDQDREARALLGARLKTVAATRPSTDPAPQPGSTPVAEAEKLR